MSYINKENLLATINEVWERRYERSNDKVLYDLYRMVVRRINLTQAADVVEVVRCKDCKHCDLCYPVKNKGEESKEGYYCDLHKCWVSPSGYCSYGKRRADDENLF